jgi:hypothetical protein
MVATNVSTSRVRRWRQFSLRGLLGLMLLCSIALVLWNTYIEPYRKQHQVLEAIKEARGKAITEAVPTTLGAWLMGKDFFINVVEVDLMTNQVDDIWLRQLRYLTRLKRLNLPANVGDEGLSALADVGDLEQLILYRGQITDEGMRYLSNLRKLRGLFLVDCRITDAGLAHLENASEMRILNLHGTEVSDAGLSHLKHMPYVHALFLGNTRVTDAGMRMLSDKSELRRLYVDDTNITEASLPHFRQLSGLRELSVAGTSIIPSALREALPQLVDIQTKRKLDEPTVCEFVETPWADVVEYLKDYHRTHIVLDAAALGERGRNTPITCNIRGKTLKEALAEILAPRMEVQIRNGFLLIAGKDNGKPYTKRLALKPGEELTRDFSHALYNPAAVNYLQTPLNDVLGDFSKTHSVPCRLDGDGWTSEAANVEVDCDLYGGCTADVLELILDRLDLHGVIENNTVLIRQGPLPKELAADR